MTLEEATATSPTWKRRVGNDHEQQTYQTNFYELTRTYPPNNLLLQNIGKTQQSYREVPKYDDFRRSNSHQPDMETPGRE